ncbi:MAG: peptidyl-prolyl cis-trans isomerase, EpsD family [Chlorobiaceae bacterium]|nr:peptidyl-prolyl cis-trans isomerase, EpsD family [Chlorobiaceae bacterium]
MKKHLFLFVLFLYALAGCSNDSVKSKNEKVAATVNGVEITERQVDYLCNRYAVQGMKKKDSTNLKLRVLSELVRMELFAGKAREMKLDQTPDYALSQYMAQKGVLASMAERKLSVKPQVSPENVAAVVQNNPLIFSKRKLFVFDEVIMPGNNLVLLESLDVMAEKGAALNQLLDELNSKKIPYRNTVRTLTSENIPTPVLTILNNLKPGFPQTVSFKDKLSMILVLHEAIPQPLEGAQAQRVASGMIMNKYNRDALSKTMNDLVDHSKIIYSDNYLKSLKNSKSGSPLPVPNASRVTKQYYKNTLTGSVLCITFILSFLALTSSMRAVSDNKRWLPNLKRKENQAPVDNTAKAYYIPYKAPDSHRIYLIIIALTIISCIAFEIVVLQNILPIWVMLSCIGLGIITGYPLTRLYRLTNEAATSRTKYLVITVILTAAIIIATQILRLLVTH